MIFRIPLYVFTVPGHNSSRKACLRIFSPRACQEFALPDLIDIPRLQMRLLSRLRITAVMAVAFTAEHADSMILSAMYLAIGDILPHPVLLLSISKLS